jgi:hypothetical protein
MAMNGLGKTLMLVGAALLVLGLLISILPGGFPLGRLPGDLRIERPGFRLYAPITTGLVLSAILTGILYLLSKVR